MRSEEEVKAFGDVSYMRCCLHRGHAGNYPWGSVGKAGFPLFLKKGHG